MNVLQNVYTCSLRNFTEDVNWNKEKQSYCQIKNFSGTTDTIRQFKDIKDNF